MRPLLIPFVLSLGLVVGCFGRSEQDDGSTSSPPGDGDAETGGTGSTQSTGGTSPSGGGTESGGGTASGGSTGGDSAFACGCPEGTNAGVELDLEDGASILFNGPPRFHDPDATEGITSLFDCHDAETPLFFTTKCDVANLFEACHPSEGCLQVKESTGDFTWLSIDGDILVEGTATLERENLDHNGLAHRTSVDGSLETESGPVGTYSGVLCHINRNDCMR